MHTEPPLHGQLPPLPYDPLPLDRRDFERLADLRAFLGVEDPKLYRLLEDCRLDARTALSREVS